MLRLAAPYAGWMALAAVLGVATIASSVGLMGASAYLIGRAAQRVPIGELGVAIVAVRFFGIARGLLRYGERVVAHEATFRLLARLRTWFYAAVEPLAPARLEQRRSGDLLARIVADVETLENFYLRAVAPPVVAVLAAGLMAVWVGSLAPSVAAALLAFLLLAGVGLPLAAWRAGQTTGREMVRGRAALTAALVDTIQGLPDLLAFGQAGRQIAQISILGRSLARLQMRMTRVAALHGAAGGLLAALASLAVVALAVPLVQSGQLDGVYLGVLALAALASFEAVAPLPQAAQYLENSAAAARRLHEIVDAVPAVVDPPGAQPLPDMDRVRLEIDNLSFAYGEGQPAALDDVSLAVEPGEIVAVVGPSGAGKSTLASLVLRFYDCDRGRIALGGHEVRACGQEDVRRLIAVVPQQPYLFNATIGDNLRLARPKATEEETVEAARQTRLHAFVESLPEGYDTWIGEQGLQLSAGQRQRIAIARALLQDAPLLVLDEPTANLDALAEREIMADLRRLAAGRTTLLITHRLGSLEGAAEIVVLSAGRVAERGTHGALMAQRGLYYRLWALQNEALAPG